MKVLLIEDNPKIAKDISYYLQVRYPEAIIVSTDQGSQGIAMVGAELPDLVILDSSLVNMDHLSLISQIRQFSNAPLLVLSDAETDADKARHLEIGADDYVCKPFNPIELLSRVKALMRRTQGLGFKPESLFSISDQISINFSTREVFISGKRIHLTPIEFELLSELARNIGRVLPHSLILERVWGANINGNRDSIKKYIYRLRSKLESKRSGRILVSERSIGYRLIKPSISEPNVSL